MPKKTPIQALEFICKTIKGQRHKHYDRTVKLSKDYRALYTGEDNKTLLERYMPREAEKAFEIRCLITRITTPAIIDKIQTPFSKVSRNDAAQFSTTLDPSNTTGATILSQVESFYGKKSLKAYMDEKARYYNAVDPNSWVVVNRSEEDKCYPSIVKSEAVYNYSLHKGIEADLVVCESDKAKESQYTYHSMDFQFSLVENNRVSDQGYKPINNETSFGEMHELPNIVWVRGRAYDVIFYDNPIDHQYFARLGYTKDPFTDEETFVSNYHKAVPRLMKLVKSISELDLTIVNHTFPQKYQYYKPCPGTPQEPCHNGKIIKDGKKVNCSLCKGTGELVHKSAQEIIKFPMPKHLEDMVDLEKLSHYVFPDVAFIKFMDEYVQAQSDEALKDVYSTDIFIKSGVQDTATGRNIDMQSVYDVLQPYAAHLSELIELGVSAIGALNGVADTGVYHAFPKDLKIKSMSQLIQDYNAAMTSEAPTFLINSLAMDIAAKTYQDNERDMAKYLVACEHMPFKGKTDAQIQYIISSGLTTKANQVLWAEFDTIMFEIETEQFQNSGVDFYAMPFDKRKELIEAKVSQFMERVNNETSTAAAFVPVPPDIDPTYLDE